ncbi:hypothetical protein CHS0354_005362 [Potamilus streckersoni]|uniref:Cysteine and tyrosine-rich protein 1 n=1 Tax=Potamilus streckersoni TaxID=2493646 RepID=A0AAE0VWB4_9BIVA|nr:hypothetical protein CHS0354_005362 [Potamilus streckersoni]
MDIHMFLIIAVLILITDLCFAAEACYNWWYSTTYYCEYGCCGDGLYRGCCSLPGIIAGSVIVGCGFIAVLIIAIICFKKHKGRTGRVMNLQSPTQTTRVISTTTGQGYSISQHPVFPLTSMDYQPPGYQPIIAPYPPGPIPGPTAYHNPTYPPKCQSPY